MELDFLKGLISESKVADSDNTTNYIVMKTSEGDITFTYERDDRLNTIFKHYEKIGLITQAQHSELLNIINTCEWDLKVDYIDGNFKKVEKYTPEEKRNIILEREKNQKMFYFNSEKELALAIEEDYRLGLESISEQEMIEVKTYIKSIQPKTEAKTFKNLPFSFIQIKRPEIMKVYEEKKDK